MLKGISPLLSPELLKVLDEMGHGDEIVFADANFPTVSTGKRIVRADGIGAVELLDAVLQLFPLDQYDEDHFIWNPNFLNTSSILNFKFSFCISVISDSS